MTKWQIDQRGHRADPWYATGEPPRRKPRFLTDQVEPGRDGRTDSRWQSPVAVRQLPMGVNIRPRGMRRGLVLQGHLKVAQYEVLGWRSEKATRPGRDDRQLLTLVKPHARDQEPNVSIVPNWTDISFASFPSTSYWAFIGSLRDESSGVYRFPLS